MDQVPRAVTKKKDSIEHNAKIKTTIKHLNKKQSLVIPTLNQLFNMGSYIKERPQFFDHMFCIKKYKIKIEL